MHHDSPKPDATRHNPESEYLRYLITRAGLTQRAAAQQIGISERLLRYYLAGGTAGYRPAPYPVQFALESLCPPSAYGSSGWDRDLSRIESTR